MDERAPTQSQIDAVVKYRKRDGVPTHVLPRTREAASEELKRYRAGAKNEYTIRGRSRRNPEKEYELRRQGEIELRLSRLKQDFLAREAERRRGHEQAPSL